MQRKVAVVIAAPACVGRTGIQVVVGIGASGHLKTDIEETVGTGIHLVRAATVGTGIEVAAGAGLHAIAARLHVPEQRFAEGHSGALVENVVIDAGHVGHGYGAQGSERIVGYGRRQSGAEVDDNLTVVILDAT